MAIFFAVFAWFSYNLGKTQFFSIYRFNKEFLMPIYEYKCLECGINLEKMQKVSDETLTVCEQCGGKLEKQWSLSGFQFKGAGWYVTDYAGKKEIGRAHV